MLHRINQALSSEQQHPVCYDGSNVIHLSQFKRDVSALYAKIIATKFSRWLITTENSYLFFVALIAVFQAERKAIISANLTPSWRQEIESQFDAIICETMPADCDKPVVDFSSCPVKAPIIDDWKLSGTESIIFYTSGSTGVPKAIKKSFNCLLKEVAILERTFGHQFDNAMVVASVSPMHIYGLLFKLLWPFVTQRYWYQEKIEFPEQLNTVSNNKLVFISSPAFLSRLDKNLAMPEMAAIFSSGGMLEYEAAQTSLQQFSRLPVEVYGSTETGGIAFRQQTANQTPWQLLEGVHVEQSQQEIRLFSSHISQQEGIVLDDRLVFDKDGRFTLEGRKDRVIKLEEKRVSLTELEQFVEKDSHVTRCMALMLPGKRKRIGVVISLSEVGNELHQNHGKVYIVRYLKNLMRDRFEPVTIPGKWRIINEFPMNSQSKIDTHRLVNLFNHKENQTNGIS